MAELKRQIEMFLGRRWTNELFSRNRILSYASFYRGWRGAAIITLIVKPINIWFRFNIVFHERFCLSNHYLKGLSGQSGNVGFRALTQIPVGFGYTECSFFTPGREACVSNKRLLCFLQERAAKRRFFFKIGFSGKRLDLDTPGGVNNYTAKDKQY